MGRIGREARFPFVLPWTIVDKKRPNALPSLGSWRDPAGGEARTRFTKVS